MSYATIQVDDEQVGQAIHLLASRFGKLHMVDRSRDGAEERERVKQWKLKASELAAAERKLDYYEDMMRRFDVDAPEDCAPAGFEPIGTRPGTNRNLVEEMKQFFRGKGGLDERDLASHANVLSTLERDLNRINEKIEVLQFALEFPSLYMGETGGAGYQNGEIETKKPLMADVESGGSAPRGVREGYKVIWGTIPTYMKNTFRRTLARVSRFNAVTYFDAEEVKLLSKDSDELVSKVSFYVVTIGKYISTTFTERLAQYMQVTVVDVPESKAKIEAELEDLEKELLDRKTVLLRTKRALRRTLRKFASMKIGGVGVFSPVATWRLAIRQERAIYEAKQLCRFGVSFVEIAGWVPRADVGKLVALVDSELGARANVTIWDKDPNNKMKQPPTYFPGNAFTEQFQSIVDTYGIAGYKEVNPGLFTIVTFPFLFGVMYGDIGHGFIMTLFGMWLVINGDRHDALAKKNKLPELIGMVHGGRYVLFLMGMFAFYCGTIYNDMFSVPLVLFETHWDEKGYYIGKTGAPYPYGVDPSWYGTKNQLQFFNSLKMKASVILGVTQMTFGISLGALNFLYNKDYIGLIFEWIPRMLFMCCTFGYMIIIIIYKWTVDWEATDRAPPNLIQTMIKMFLSPGHVDPSMELYPHQATVQLYLISIALLSVPVMLLAKPLIMEYCMPHHKTTETASHSDAENGHEMSNIVTETSSLTKNVGSGGYGSIDNKEESQYIPDDDDDDHTHEGGKHSFSETMIHQGIHTIEFVLGCVSNTASYLRLWALSLAHAELAEVFWSKLIVGLGLEGGFGPVGMVIGFASWFMATFAVLLCMDTMECVLHALRLHWVEFQNKFYHADGYKFKAVDFNDPEFFST
eukprot:CAMPEP_0197534058 /NCGR_PEP_ID=MMETSP1318-20131121/45803_1 /TAXON_ID=552666 /ORGANISM="Partenskyella glossopodia, Strain RCC365" /LENGTH=861 /DNA_ID=CAMNT_0043091175 /DNA_START=128 /DNA_END=2713 /DNA_ORIENTATION=+